MGEIFSSNPNNIQISNELSKSGANDWLKGIVEEYEKKIQPYTTIKDFNFRYNGERTPQGKSSVNSFIIIEYEVDSRKKALETCLKLPVGDKSTRYQHKKMEYFDREHIIYSFLIPEFNLFNNNTPYKIQIPEVLYDNCQKSEFILMLKDERADGFTTPGVNNLNFKQSKIAIQQIAILHATSFAYNSKFNIPENFPCFRNRREDIETLCHVFKALLDNTIHMLKHENQSESIVSKLEVIYQMTPEKIIERIVDFENREDHVLLHGDFRANHLMFRYIEPEIKNTPDKYQNESQFHDDIRILDWQVAHWGNKYMDLHEFFHTSISNKMRKENTDELLDEYYNTYSKILNEHNLLEKANTLFDFKQGYYNSYDIGFYFGIMINQLIRSKKIEKYNDYIKAGNEGVFSSIINALSLHICSLLGIQIDSLSAVTDYYTDKGQDLIHNKELKQYMINYLESLEEESILTKVVNLYSSTHKLIIPG